jgi:chromosome segregation ATPase
MLSQENYELKSNLNKYLSSIQDLKSSSDYLESSLRSLELENKSLKEEKNYLESILKTCKSGFTKENFLTSNELESLERDRLDIQYQMLKYQSDPRSKDGMMLRELGNRLEVCERQISSFYGSNSGRVRTETPMRKLSIKPELRPLSLNRLRYDSATPVRDKSIYNNVI